MFAKQLAVSLVFLIVAPVLADGDAPLNSQPIPKPVIDFVQPIPLPVPHEPSISPASGVTIEPQHENIASAAAEASAPRQVRVQLQLVEINMTKLRKMGMDFSSLHSDGNRQADSSAHSVSSGDSKLSTLQIGLPSGFAIVPSHALAEFLKQLADNNIAKVMADPEIVSVSGHPASFHVGGDFPLPSGPGSTSAVDFRHYGTEVNLLAKILSNSDIDLDVKFRVSVPDESRTTNIGGVQVPTITAREICTDVIVPNHQTAVLTGLNQERIESQVSDGHVENQTNEIKTLVTISADIVPETMLK